MDLTIKHGAIAGTTESSDIQILLDENPAGGIEIDLTSSVLFQFGDQIKKVITETLQGLGINNATVKATDKGALDCVVRARVSTAAFRAADTEAGYDWKEMATWNA